MLAQIAKARGHFGVPVAGMVRVQAGGGVQLHAVPGAAHLGGADGAVQTAAGDHNGADPGGGSTLQHHVAVGVKTVVVQVGTDVGQVERSSGHVDSKAVK